MPAPDYTHTRLADLLKIRERPSDYMPEAYEAAEKELASRKPDADILSKAQRELEIWKASEESRNQHVEAVDGKPDQIKDYFLYISQQIKEKPEHYLWSHKRWKHRDKVPPEFQDSY